MDFSSVLCKRTLTQLGKRCSQISFFRSISLCCRDLSSTSGKRLSVQNGRQHPTSSSVRSRQRNTSLAGWIFHQGGTIRLPFPSRYRCLPIHSPTITRQLLHPPFLLPARRSQRYIHPYGEQEVSIRLSGRTYNGTFIIADVRHPLLGADFLSHFNLVVDVARHRLLHTDSFTSVPLCISNIEENINPLSPDDNYSDIIKDFDNVLKPELRLSPGTAAKHGVQHNIKTTGPPVHSRYRRLRPELSQIAKEAFAEMEKMGVCSKPASPLASPLHMTPKKDGTWRPCGDYRLLNIITEPDHYVMPNISDLTSSIGTARIFSKLDLLKGYFQVPVNPDDVPKTAITTPFGTYVFHYSSFGLCNSGATFQVMMDQILGHLPFCRVYIDAMLIASENHREHREHLRAVLEVLHSNGLVTRRDKCSFGASAI